MKTIISRAIHVLLANLLLLACSSVWADLYTETPDAGDSLDNSQSLPGGTTEITGTLGEGDGVDLFEFYWGGGEFYVNSVGTTWDSQLFLFASDGTGLWANDDGISHAGPAYLTDSALAAGVYYLGITAYNYDPYSASGLMFQSYPYDTVYGPSNSDPLAYWSGVIYATGSYLISFQGVTSTGEPIPGTGGSTGDVQVPEPATLALLGLGLIGLGANRRKTS